ncbi:unnamed protein product [Colias eurytheme]|nr:unnamed protein product [Colias eurytheme]
MEAIQQSLAQMSELFNKRMLDFQQELQKSTSTTTLASPPSRLASDFLAFRSFVVTSLQCLQTQVDSLSQMYDSLEMRNRRKILLLHGVAEDTDKSPITISLELMSKHLKVPNLSADCITQCHRLGSLKDGKPRPILLKFNNLSLKQELWSAKAKLKGSGVTLSEFLTKHRHDLFMSTRERFGVTKCWTRDGRIFVIARDGSRHRVETIADLKAIASDTGNKPCVSGPTKTDSSKDVKAAGRNRRQVKVK